MSSGCGVCIRCLTRGPATMAWRFEQLRRGARFNAIWFAGFTLASMFWDAPRLNVAATASVMVIALVLEETFRRRRDHKKDVVHAIIQAAVRREQMIADLRAPRVATGNRAEPRDRPS
jgi:hypothetical protein